MATYEFLSDQWFEEVDRLREPLHALEEKPLNIRVTGGPGGERLLHLAGMDVGQGFVDQAKATINVSHATARRLLFDAEDMTQAAMQAVMGGEIKVEGDLTSVMDLATPLSDSGLTAEDQKAMITILRKRLGSFTE